MDPEDNMEYEALLRQFQPRKPELPPGLQPRPGYRTGFRLAAAVAAISLLLVFAVGVRRFVSRVDTQPVLEKRLTPLYRVEDGGSVLALADGSRVEVRPKSEFAVEPADDGLRLRLNRGGVIVTAAKQRGGHLYVQTRDMTVMVVGTVFLVEAEDAGSRVVVIEGEVQVQQGAAVKKLAASEQLSTNPVIPVVSIAAAIAWSRSASAHLELIRRATLPAAPAHSPQKTSPVATPTRLEFAAASIKSLAPRTAIAGSAFGIACRGVDGMQVVIVSIINVPGEPSGSRVSDVNAPQGRCIGNGIFFANLLEIAYGTLPRFISDWPDWARQTIVSPAIINPGSITFPRTTSFQIEAVAEDPSKATLDQLRQMLQALLADRFMLKVHREQREARGYSLVVAKNGPRLKEVDEQPDSWLVLNQAKSTIHQLTQRLINLVDAPVVDRTGLTGVYQYELRLPPRGGQRGADIPQPDMSDRVADISAALESQLGLRLQAEKSVPVEFIVIDQAEAPSPN